MEQQLETPQADIVVGLAIVKAHGSGGWALLGGGTTQDFDEALAHGTAMDQTIDRFGGRSRATRQGRWPRRRSA